jgi:hypothetical protein
VGRRSGRPFDSRAALEQALESLVQPDSRAGRSVQLELAIDRLWHDEFGPMLDPTDRLMTAAREREDPSMISMVAAFAAQDEREGPA